MSEELNVEKHFISKQTVVTQDIMCVNGLVAKFVVATFPYCEEAEYMTDGYLSQSNLNELASLLSKSKKIISTNQMLAECVAFLVKLKDKRDYDLPDDTYDFLWSKEFDDLITRCEGKVGE